MSQSYWNKRPNPQTTKVFSPNLSEGQQLLTVNKDLSIPIISCINNQNNYLIESTQALSAQLQKLTRLSQSLMYQNQKLRSHYYQRNQDLKNLINTIRINIAQQVNDRQHEIHLIREVNCKVFKNIQIQMKDIDQHQERINQLTKRFQLLKQNNVQMEIKVVHMHQVRAKSHLNEAYVAKQQKKLDAMTSNEEKLLKQTSDLVQKVNRIQKLNLGNIRMNNNNSFQNVTDKKMYKQQIISALKSLGQLKIENNQLADFLAKSTKNMEDRKKKLIQLKDKVQKGVKQKQKNEERLNNILNKKQSKTQQMIETDKSIKTMFKQAKKAQEQKQKLINQIIQRKRRFEQIKTNHLEEKERIKKVCDKDIYQIKTKINEVQNQAFFKKNGLNLQFKQEQRYLQSLKNQYKELQKDFLDYNQIFQKFSGPAQEVQKAILQYRLIRNGQPLQKRENNRIF